MCLCFAKHVNAGPSEELCTLSSPRDRSNVVELPEVGDVSCWHLVEGGLFGPLESKWDVIVAGLVQHDGR